MEKWMRRLTRLELVLVFLVILAGSVVRMTGSGMGCPDWPKCFGYLVPPTERVTLEWAPDRDFRKGQMIVKDEALYVAQENFTAPDDFQAANWQKYTRHDYAHFNPTHTWIEYINRLLGALSGLPMLLLFFLSLGMLRHDLRIPFLSLSGLLMLGFEAWLGKKVVDGNLIPGSITIHMLGAFLILAILLLLLGVLSQAKMKKRYYTLWFRNLMILSLIVTLFQVILGTQVREQVDALAKLGLDREQWMQELDWLFYIHRSFSLLVVALGAWLWRYNRSHQLGFWQFRPIMILLVLEVLIGIVLAYWDLPRWAQPAHLMFGAFIFVLQFHAVVNFSLGPTKRIVPVR